MDGCLIQALRSWRTTALPGQYVVLRLQPSAGSPLLFRSYSLSGPPSTERYRISVKIESNGAAGIYLRDHVRLGDALDVSSPRGSFILQSGERPVVLLSAGIGATPVLAMLHALAAARSTRQVLWLHGSRSATSPIRRRSPPPHARAHTWSQPRLLQQP
jgi:ferredoxin-NADP reductase